MLNRFLIALLGLFIGFLSWYFVSIQAVAPQNTTEQVFEVPTGSSLNQIINLLSVQKLIRSRTAFKITVMRYGLQNKLQAGYFRLSPSMSATTLANSLTKAYAKQIKVTIPEGLRAEEIVQIVSKAFQTDPKNNFNSSVFSTLALKNEGQLYPDTYNFAEGTTAEEVLSRLTSQHQKVISDLKISSDQVHKVLIIASLLEREAANSQEMPQIAGVIEKRLANSWPLQIDATVQYALASKQCKKLDCDWWKQNLTLDDLNIASPYNTYKNQGLPPKPISNPGRDALSAANKPVSSSAWFYLHDLSGQIHFADTIDQHNQNVCLFLKKDCK